MKIILICFFFCLFCLTLIWWLLFFNIKKVYEPPVKEHKVDKPQVKEQDEKNDERDNIPLYGFFIKKNTLNRITFLITWEGKPWHNITIDKTSIEQLKKDLLNVFQNFETWVDFVKTKGCVDGYNKLLLKHDNDFELYAIIENNTPRLMLVICGHTMTGNLAEMVGFFTDLFRTIDNTEEFDKLLTNKTNYYGD